MRKELTLGRALLIILGVVVIFRVIPAFPVARFDGRAIRMFSSERLLLGGLGDFDGRVFGRQVLQTEHGEITLENRAPVFSGNGTIVMIRKDTFTNGLASHNLVIEGIEMPQNINVVFNRDSHRIARVNLYDQEIMLSGIPFSVGLFHLEHPRHTADITMDFRASGYVALTDNTQIYFELMQEERRILRGFYIYKNEGLWVILQAHSSGFPVKLPGETEFARYRSITFEAWLGGIYRRGIV